jgi:ATP phosphoribosyltransferase
MVYSEVAFDFGIWEQSDSDLRERMDEAIQEETEKKIELSAHARNLQTEIEELLRKVDELTIEKKKALKDLDHVESVIKDTLQPFMGEKQEHDREYQAIQQRKEDTDHITVK